jgi:hypothetical protein
MSWADQLKTRADLRQAARELGLNPGQGGGLAPCPACGALRRGGHDARGPIGLRSDGAGWRCHRCDAAGTVLDLLTEGLYGAKWNRLSTEQRVGLQDWAARHGWCDSPPASMPRAPQRNMPAQRIAPNTAAESAPSKSAVEIKAIWTGCTPVDQDAEACDYLAGRRINPLVVTDRDLARALPTNGGPLPDLCRCRGRAWADVGYRLVVPFYDACGHLRSLQAGRVRHVPEGFPKAASPRGARFAGLVAADPLGRMVMSTGVRPDWWTPSAQLKILIAEGLPDFLTVATIFGDAADLAPAVLGVISGCWTDSPFGDALAARMPRGSQIVIATDHDPAGDKYAEQIAATLRRRGGFELRRHT